VAISGVTTFLWFDEAALEAAEFYVGLFPDSRITSVSHYGEGAQMPEGTVMVVEFVLFGQPFAALNGGPQFPHTEAVSFKVEGDTQDDIDRVWDALVHDGGEESRCGWCRDRFGVSWQVVPARLGELMGGADAAASGRAWSALMQMGKIDIATLQAAKASGS
jgi:predicted 3-demethylubiquinone-9 3-methyltransferase (glyoxalase superfamily)